MQQTAGQVLEFQEKIPSQAVREIKRNVRLLLDEERKKNGNRTRMIIFGNG